MPKLRNTLAALLCALLLTASAAAAQPNDRRADTGILVYSAGTISIAMNFAFRFRRIALPSGAATRDHEGMIGCRCVGIIRARISNPDFTGRQVGKVFLQRLPAGEYEIYDFGFGGSIGMMTTTYRSATPFALHFRINAGEATYVGNYARAPSMGTALQPQFGVAGYFVISDQSERDIAIARQKDPTLPPVHISVPDIAALGHPAIFARDPLQPAD